MFYLDELATTELSNEVKNKIINVLDLYGNPSSVYSIGLENKKHIKDARTEVYKFINADENTSDIIFTSSGSASNSLAIKGITEKLDNYILFYSPIAHKSMILASKSCKYSHKLNVNRFGTINIKDLVSKIKEAKDYQPIVCIDVSNSEIGTIQRIRTITNIVHKYNGIVICDFTSYIPMYKLDVSKLDIDIATFSGHKLHAPKGIGVLYKKHNIELCPLVYGSQENGLFAGTENIIGITALGEALKNYKYKTFEINKKRNYMLSKLLSSISNCYVIGSMKHRLPNNIYMCITGIDGNELVSLLDLDNIKISTGSACNNGDLIHSTTLQEIKLNKKDINSCIRITINNSYTLNDYDNIVETIVKNVRFLRGD